MQNNVNYFEVLKLIKEKPEYAADFLKKPYSNQEICAHACMFLYEHGLTFRFNIDPMVYARSMRFTAMRSSLGNYLKMTFGNLIIQITFETEGFDKTFKFKMETVVNGRSIIVEDSCVRLEYLYPTLERVIGKAQEKILGVPDRECSYAMLSMTTDLNKYNQPIPRPQLKTIARLLVECLYLANEKELFNGGLNNIVTLLDDVAINLFEVKGDDVFVKMELDSYIFDLYFCFCGEVFFKITLTRNDCDGKPISECVHSPSNAPYDTLAQCVNDAGITNFKEGRNSMLDYLNNGL